MGLQSFETLKSDYDIHTIVSHDIPPLDILSRQFNPAGPVLIQHSGGIALCGYDLEKRKWQIKTLQIDSDVQNEISQLFRNDKVKLSQLSNTLKDQICSNHSEVVRQLPRQATLRTDEAKEIAEGMSETHRIALLFSVPLFSFLLSHVQTHFVPCLTPSNRRG
jgi:hypothetical protein